MSKDQARTLRSFVQQLKSLATQADGMDRDRTIQYAANRLYIKGSFIKELTEVQRNWLWS